MIDQLDAHNYMLTMTEVAVPITVAGFHWVARFDLAIDEQSARVTVRVYFDGPTAKSDEWEATIEETWNRKAFLIDDDRAPIPIKIDFQVVSPEAAHHAVTVATGPWQDMLNWQPSIDGLVAAHEVGHMLGASDEYEGGATEHITTNTLMSDRSPVVPLFYFDTIADAAGLQFSLIAPQVGTSKADCIKGDLDADAIYGEGGRDVIRGKAGDDYLSGDKGRDKLFGGSGADVFVVSGRDKIRDYDPSEGDIIVG